jgi:hypothetical protein
MPNRGKRLGSPLHKVQHVSPDDVRQSALGTMTDKYPRGICFHEAGHAVVLWTFAVPVAAIRVTFTEERGWYGGTDIAGTAGHLPLLEQFAAFAAGYTAENVFDCHAHDKAAHDDHGQIAALLLDKRIRNIGR